MKIKNENYYVIHGWMLNELKLRGNELAIYAIIYGFSQDGNSEFSGSLDYLIQWSGASRSTVIRALKTLVEDGYIIKTETVFNGVKMNKYRYSEEMLQNALNNALTENDDASEPENDDTSENSIQRALEQEQNDVGGVKMTREVSNTDVSDENGSPYQNDMGGVKMTRVVSNEKISSNDSNWGPDDIGGVKMTRGVSLCDGGSTKMTPNNIDYNIDLNSFDKKDNIVVDPKVKSSA